MNDIVDTIFKDKFTRSVAKSAIITTVFFATIDQFVTAILKNTGVFLLAIIPFYLMFNVFAFIKNDP